VALTFNGGPNSNATRAVAAELEARGLAGTFFVVGDHVRRGPDVLRDLTAAGHEIGVLGMNPEEHDWWRPTWDHHRIDRELVRAATGACPRFARPPHGKHTPFMSRHADDASMRLVSYDVEAIDWGHVTAATIANQVLEHVEPGSIVMMHDGLGSNSDPNRAVLIDALPTILDGLEQRGLRPVLLSELLDDHQRCDSPERR
jgi:peptidoglycan/xylan/chitin deacetylase (PgdA/CDA1 family)